MGGIDAGINLLAASIVLVPTQMVGGQEYWYCYVRADVILAPTQKMGDENPSAARAKGKRFWFPLKRWEIKIILDFNTWTDLFWFPFKIWETKIMSA